METGNKQIILVVDDSLLICDQIRKALKGEPVFISEAHNGSEAEEAVQQYQPDLILLDVVLPDTEGYELFGKLKELDKNHAVIIFLTSKDKDEDVVKGFSMGACDYIKKPFVQSELRSRVNAHLTMKKQKDELARMNEELRSNMEKLNILAFRDGLTGLYNRRYVVGDLLEEIKNCDREDKKNFLIMADIDDFKNINDTYGHDAGDMVLVCLANILEGACRGHKVVRWGGEEFLLILFGITEEEAFGLSEKIRKEVEGFQIFYGDKAFSMTLTMGLHIYQEETGIEESIQCADKALYHGKRSGKNCSVWYKNIE